MFKKHVPEKVIQQVTGHRSVEGLRHYEKVGSTKRQAASNILTNATNRSTYQEEVQMLHSSSQQISSNRKAGALQPKLPHAQRSSLPKKQMGMQSFRSSFLSIIFSAGSGTCNVHIAPQGNFVINPVSQQPAAAFDEQGQEFEQAIQYMPANLP